MDSRSIHMFIFNRFEMLDAMGPLEAFATASTIAGGGYRVEMVALKRGLVRTSSGLVVEAKGQDDVPDADTFLVCGGIGVLDAAQNPQSVDYVREASLRARRIGSVCTGAFLLAKTGLLNGRKVATHWNWCHRLAEEYPQLTVEEDPIFLRSGNIWTSAGVTSGIDLALSMIEEDHGAELALKTARELVVYLRRPGGQSQFSTELKSQAASEPAIRRVQAWVTDHCEQDLRIETMAAIAGMSPRNFSRVFKAETGYTAAAFVLDVRVARVSRLLETSKLAMDVIAHRSGFGSDDSMRRAFQRLKGVSPMDYRDRFVLTAA